MHTECPRCGSKATEAACEGSLDVALDAATACRESTQSKLNVELVGQIWLTYLRPWNGGDRPPRERTGSKMRTTSRVIAASLLAALALAACGSDDNPDAAGTATSAADTESAGSSPGTDVAVTNAPP